MLTGEQTQPLWPIYDQLVQPTPTPAGVAWCWSGAALRAQLEAADISVAHRSSRRVMLLHNPGLPGPAATHTLVAGVQLLLPGEHAPVHRHTQSGIRLMLSGQVALQLGPQALHAGPGDLVVLPPTVPHGHRCIGPNPALWVDVLDVPTVRFLRATFSDEGGDIPALPPRPGQHHPLPTADDSWTDATHPLGHQHRYRSPDGHDILPTIRATLHHLPPGGGNAHWRSTASSVWVVLEGSGVLRVDGPPISWSAHDVFVVPNWTPFALTSASGARLVSLSDAALLDALGLLMEGRA